MFSCLALLLIGSYLARHLVSLNFKYDSFPWAPCFHDRQTDTSSHMLFKCLKKYIFWTDIHHDSKKYKKVLNTNANIPSTKSPSNYISISRSHHQGQILKSLCRHSLHYLVNMCIFPLFSKCTIFLSAFLLNLAYILKIFLNPYLINSLFFFI